MKKQVENFRNEMIKSNTKNLIKRAMKKNLIKSHVLAFDNTPVESENHKGRLNFYKNK